MWGCRDVTDLQWLDLPPAVNLAAARELLTALGALKEGQLTARGRQMAQFGNDPRLAAISIV
ncbi:ATP-dependent helicase HrpB [Cronobacter malonaticus 507]|nr:ATP-dependent helicase HrpB [Cronobacter malonaticus 507]